MPVHDGEPVTARRSRQGLSIAYDLRLDAIVPVQNGQNGPLSTMAPKEGHSGLWEGRVPDLASWMGLAVRARVRTCLSKLAPGPDVPVQVGPQMTIVQNDLVYGAPKMTHALDSEGVGGEFDAPPALLRGLDHEFN